MTNPLLINIKLVLPSGNVVTLVMPDGDDWVCRYDEFSRARGEVILSAKFLQRWAKRA